MARRMMSIEALNETCRYILLDFIPHLLEIADKYDLDRDKLVQASAGTFKEFAYGFDFGTYDLEFINQYLSYTFDTYQKLKNLN